MKRLIFLLFLGLLLAASGTLLAQEPVPTLVPPTLVPALPSDAVDALASESGVARIQRDGAVRIGILYNEPQFGELSVRSDSSGQPIIAGFDADLGRAIAEAWGVTAQFTQVTRQSGIDLLTAGAVDLLIAAQPHFRDLDSRIEFSQSYYLAEQMMLVRETDSAQNLPEMANRRVGYVVGTRAETAVNYWLTRSGTLVSLQPYYTMDQALAALYADEVDGIVGNRARLVQAVGTPGIARFLPQPVMPEPYAIAMQRQDVNLRDLVDHTLQYLYQSGKLNEIHKANFNGVDYPLNTMTAWANVGDSAPTPSGMDGSIPYPAQYAAPRILSEGSLRVAGLVDVPADAPQSVRSLDTVHRALVNELARRWGVNVVIMPDNGQPAISRVASGEADLAVGVVADWNAAAQVDFTEPYLMHGLQLMVEDRRNIAGIGDLRGKAVGIFSDDQASRDVLVAQAEAVRAVVNDIYQVANDEDAAFAILAATDINLDAVFGDSIRLRPHILNNPDTLSLLSDADGRPIFFSREYLSLATPRNDLDFRLLVEYTMQEMALDGTLATIISPAADPASQPPYEVWPGAASFMGRDLAG
ncbi:MAG TPA: transporter substrate-binding domain-containing protein [Candidatus Limnocylindrales bacterium]|nr:transporter substrate-binding domain-containing protein [Candidatus Limnocylindrales bacterium]